MDNCPICGHALVSDACLQPACIQIVMRVEQAEADQAELAWHFANQEQTRVAATAEIAALL